jgi:hypothetical protein
MCAWMCDCMLMHLICNACALVCRFLSAFQDNKGNTKGFLKFTRTFTMTVTHTDKAFVTRQEDWFSMGDILVRSGISRGIKHYPNTQEALDAVRYLCKKNAEEEKYTRLNKHERLDEKYPEFSKFWFVFDSGKTTVAETKTEKQLNQDADLKGDQLDQVKDIFMEGCGYQDESEKHSEVTIVNEKSRELNKQLELMRQS